MPLAVGLGMLIVLSALSLLISRSSMRHYLGNILVPACLIAISLLFLAMTFGFRLEEAGPAVIPRLYIFLILALSGVILGRVLYGKDKVVPKIERSGLLALVMASLIGYFAAISVIGYFLSSFLFIVLMLNLLAYRRQLFIYLIAGGWVVFSYAVFYKLLYIQLPLGFFEGLF